MKKMFKRLVSSALAVAVTGLMTLSNAGSINFGVNNDSVYTASALGRTVNASSTMEMSLKAEKTTFTMAEVAAGNAKTTVSMYVDNLDDSEKLTSLFAGFKASDSNIKFSNFAFTESEPGLSYVNCPANYTRAALRYDSYVLDQDTMRFIIQNNANDYLVLEDSERSIVTFDVEFPTSMSQGTYEIYFDTDFLSVLSSAQFVDESDPDYGYIITHYTDSVISNPNGLKSAVIQIGDRNYDGEIEIWGDNVPAEPGDTVSMNVYADADLNGDGTIMGLEVSADYDESKLTLQNITVGLGFEAKPTINIPCAAYVCVSPDNPIVNNPDKPFMTLTFKVSENVNSGETIEIGFEGVNGAANPVALKDYDSSTNTYTYYKPVVIPAAISVVKSTEITAATTAKTTTTTTTTTTIKTTTKATTTTTKATTTTTTTKATTTTTITKATTTTTTTTVTTSAVKFVYGVNNWSFGNSPNNFGYGSYNMKKDYMDNLYDGLNNTEKELISYYMNEQWHGSCYGLAATSILSCYGILNPSEWQNGANFLHDIDGPPSADVESLINYYFALQGTDYVQQHITNALYSDDEAGKLQNLLDCLKDGSPVLLCFYGKLSGGSWGGHAVTAYDVEYGTWVKNGIAYNGRVLVYDNNCIAFDDNYCLYFNSSKMNWAIPHYSISSDTGAVLGLITDDLDIINYHGYLNGTEKANTNPFVSILSSKQIAADYSLRKVTMSNGSWTSAATSEDDIKMFSSLSDTPGQSGDVRFALKDSGKGYLMKLDSPESLDLSMRYENYLFDAEASNASQALFDPSGYIEISGEDSDYSLSIVANDGCYPTDWYKINVSGKAADSMSIQEEDNGYIMEGDNFSDVIISANNDANSAVFRFSTSYDKVFIYEIDEKTIGVSIDSDNNGTFETQLNNTISESLGDVNMDGSITVADVVLMQKFFVNSEKFSVAQCAVADYNSDGCANIFDAACLKRFVINIK